MAESVWVLSFTGYDAGPGKPQAFATKGAAREAGKAWMPGVTWRPVRADEPYEGWDERGDDGCSGYVLLLLGRAEIR